MSKKQSIIQTATYLFATQGFDGTTTIQLAEEAGVTEPLLYYHFTGKDGIFTSILASVFEDYFSRLKTLQVKTPTQFEKIQNLFELHFQLIAEMPHEMSLAVSAKPVKLNDPENIYSKNTQSQKKRLNYYLSNCLKRGIQTGEFNQVPVKETTNVLTMMIDGILKQKDFKANKKMMAAIIDLCRRSLVAK
jgi:AcrR family transcriptional regulator